MFDSISIVIGAGIGALCRYGLALVISGTFIPYSTFCANCLGCFGIGLCWVLFEYFEFNTSTVLGVTVGFLGSLTTFSTYQIELVRMIKSNLYLEAALYFSLSNILGFLCVLFGYFVATKLVSL